MTAAVEIRYAVVGSPIGHSLSPLLALLTAAHLRRNDVFVRVESVAWLETDRIEAAMSWGMTGSGPEIAPELNRDDSTALEIDELVAGADFIIEDVTEAPVAWGASQREPPAIVTSGPGLFAETAVWLSITSPLKHQLGRRSGVDCVDDGLDLAATNQIVWAGGRWSGASTDGFGLVRVAHAFGLFSGDGPVPVLVMRGGGSSARSAAAAWAGAGGVIEVIRGRRMLDRRGPWSESCLDDKHAKHAMGPRMTVDFDSTPGSEVRPDEAFDRTAMIHLAATYQSGADARPAQSMDGSKSLDGRWLLTAQHLEAWARLLRPDLDAELPDLALSVARLQAFERHITESKSND